MENKLQSEIVRKFSELYPEKRGQLFHVPNQMNTKDPQKSAFQAKALGIFSGVSDLIFFEGIEGEHIRMTGLEIKTPGSAHKKEHISRQVIWGKILQGNGGIWRLVTNVDDAIKILDGNNSFGLSPEEVHQMLFEDSLKTIKF